MVKRAVLIALAVVGSTLVYDRLRRHRAEQELWREATDSDLVVGP